MKLSGQKSIDDKICPNLRDIRKNYESLSKEKKEEIIKNPEKINPNYLRCIKCKGYDKSCKIYKKLEEINYFNSLKI
jgi:predicted transcriptional regulator